MFQQQFEYFRRCQFPKKNGQGLCTRKAIDGSQFCKQHTNLIRQQNGAPKIPYRSKQRAQQPLDPFMNVMMQQMFPQVAMMNNPMMYPMMNNPRMNPMNNPMMNPMNNPRMNPLAQKSSPFSPFFKKGRKKERGFLSASALSGLRLCPRDSAKHYNSLASPRLKQRYKDDIIDKILLLSGDYDELDREGLRRKQTKTLCGILKESFEESPGFLDGFGGYFFDNFIEEEES